MMTRRRMMALGALGTLVVFAALLMLVRARMAEAAERLLTDLTGAGVHIGEMQVSWLPPSVVVRDLNMVHDGTRVFVRRVALYPDFNEAIRGRIVLVRAAVEDSLVELSSSGEGGAAFDPSVLPSSLRLENATFVTGAGTQQRTSFSFSANMERKPGSQAFVIKRISADQLGLELVGELEFASLDPLAVRFVGGRGAVAPSRLADRLLPAGQGEGADRFGLSDEDSISFSGLNVEYDFGSGELDLDVAELATSGCVLRGFGVRLADGGWRLSCLGGELEAERALRTAAGNPDVDAALRKGLAAVGLGDVSASGSLQVQDVVLGCDARGEVFGEGVLAARALALGLKSESGQRQNLFIDELDGRLTFDKTLARMGINRLTMRSGSEGSASCAGSISLPFSMEQARFALRAEKFDWFSTVLSGTLSKREADRLDYSLAVSAAGTELQSKGLVTLLRGGQGDWAAVAEELEIHTAETPEESEAAGDDSPFSFDFIPEDRLSGKLVCKRFQFNDLPVVKSMVVDVHSAGGEADLHLRGQACLMAFTAKARLGRDGLDARAALGASGAMLPGLLGCFVDELPVFLRGRVTLRLELAAHGRSPSELSDSLSGSGLLRVQQAQVLKLSNLDERLGFFIQLLNAAGLEPKRLDSIDFRDGAMSAVIKDGMVTLRNIKLLGSPISVTGSGSFGLEDHRLKLDSTVQTRFGTNDAVHIDMILSKEGSS